MRRRNPNPFRARKASTEAGIYEIVAGQEVAEMTLHDWHVAAAEALARVPTPEGKRFAEVLSHGSLAVEIDAPRGADPQTPHTRDEV